MNLADIRTWLRKGREAIPIWLWVSMQAILLLVVILIPALFLSSMEAGLLSGFGTGIASAVLVLLIVVVFIPIGFGTAYILNWAYGLVKGAVSRS